MEIFGYFGQKYNERKEEKINLYRKHKLKLISLDSRFFQCRYETLYQKLVSLCKSNGIKSESFFDYNQNLFLSGSRDFLGFIRSKLSTYITRHNTLPNSRELRNMGFSGLERIINNLGGYKEVCNQLGLDSERFRNSWNEVNSKSKFLWLCEKVNRIPTDKDYEKYGLGGLKRYVYKNQKKMIYEELAREKGFASIVELKEIMPSGYWSLSTIKDTITPLCELFSRIPTKSELLELGMSELECAIQQYTSREELSRILGVPTYNLQNGVRPYIFEDLKDELTPIVKQFGYLPSRKELDSIGKKKLYHHIDKFGGPSKFAEKLNIPTFSQYRGIKRDGFWKDEKNLFLLIEHELLPLVQELGFIPNESFLRNEGLYEISQLIQKFGKRKKMSEYLGFPTYSEYKGTRENGYWEDVTNLKTLILEKLLPLVEKLGYIPTEKYLKERGLRELRLLIEKFGGRNKISDYLGYPTYNQVKNEELKNNNRSAN
ncbi:hypothetical protein B5V88_16975 [Heyndrickxia sporothermodurans]|nr:hypothetical protein B5V88_16975 [Heyndrickxia sporothermodurans]